MVRLGGYPHGTNEVKLVIFILIVCVLRTCDDDQRLSCGEELRTCLSLVSVCGKQGGTMLINKYDKGQTEGPCTLIRMDGATFAAKRQIHNLR